MKKRIECSRCLLDNYDDENIIFNEKGVCNYCLNYDKVMETIETNPEQLRIKLEAKVKEMKCAGKKSKYDCILGVSGGVDSTYLAYWAWQEGLNPLLVHLDNGWNSELAVKNIENIIKKTNFHLHTHVIDWEEFRDLQLAYFRASVVDIEVLTDNAIASIIQDLAKKYKIKYTLSGWNHATELIMPKGWTYDKTDLLNIKDIVKQYGNIRRFKTFPVIGFWKKLYNNFFLKIESVDVLNYIKYEKNKIKKIIIDKFDWIDYGGKHYESLFTKFYQAYILPNKFGIDKRKAHLSNLICSRQITKEQAKKELKKELYPKDELEEEKEYVLKKFNLSEEEFKSIMNEKPRSHNEFKSDKKLWDRYFYLVSKIKKSKS